MKNLFTLAIAFLAFGAFGQVDIKETNVNIDGGKNGFEINIPYADTKSIEKELKDLMKSWKGNFSEKKGVMKSDDCKNKKMGENTFDAYAKVEADGEEGVKAYVAIDLGGAYMSSSEHGSQFKIIEADLKEWAIKSAKNFVGEIVKEQEKILKEKQKELEDLEKEQKKKEAEIEDYKKKIEENEKAVEESKKGQEEKKTEIKEQEGVVQEALKKQEGIK